ncbi:MAG TPA: transposase [Acidobacteriaceae bacterium]|nr:transposase [Acidobacteriaceae bacterium]
MGLDRLETASFLRFNGTFQYLTGLPSFLGLQTLRRFLHHAPDSFLQQMHRVNDRLLQNLIHLPNHRSRLIFDLDSPVVTVFGRQEHAEIGYRGKKSDDPLLCIEANSSYLWDVELRSGNAGTWDGSVGLLASCFVNLPPDIRELRVRADAGFGFHPVLEILEARAVQYAVVARLTQAFKRWLPGLRYESVNRQWEMAEFEYRAHGWPQARRFVVARRFIQQEEAETTLFSMGRYVVVPG